jgi:glycosyltransferase involved in cell wall biosynthesis
MRIGINCLRIVPSYAGGVNSFTFGLIDGLVRVAKDHEFTIFVNEKNRQLFERYVEAPNCRLVELNETKYLPLRWLFWHSPAGTRHRLPMDTVNAVLNSRYARILTEEADLHLVTYCPPPLFPFPQRPCVCCIHDLQHKHFPDFFTREQRTERDSAFDRCIEHAAIIQASSEYMRQDFLEQFPSLDENRVVVIPEGVDIALFARPLARDKIKCRYQLPDQFLFFPAQLWRHKNHITVLRALKRLRGSSVQIPLVLTGSKYEGSQAVFDYIEQNGLGHLVRYLGMVPFEDIVALHQAARFLITAVLYESSSIPVLEAAAAGTPIIASRTPPNEEHARHLRMHLFSPMDDGELADLLARVWNDDEVIKEHVEANRIAVQRYSWDNAAREYLRVFDSLQQGIRRQDGRPRLAPGIAA